MRSALSQIVESRAQGLRLVTKGVTLGCGHFLELALGYADARVVFQLCRIALVSVKFRPCAR
jgi:hypothetical protein